MPLRPQSLLPTPHRGLASRLPMTLGVYLPISHPGGLPAPNVVIDYARDAEDLGFDGLWVGDHLLWRTPMLDAATTLAAVAGATRRVSLGTNVYLLGLRHALLSARTLGTLAYLSGERLILGVGVGGEFEAEFEALGVPVKERGRRLDQALSDVRAWWGHESSSVVSARVAPAPAPTLPLWVGGRSDPALRRAVRVRADAWTAHFSTPDQVTEMRERLREIAREGDRRAPAVAVTLNVNVAEDGGQDARRFAEAHFGMPYERIGRHVIAGDLETCVRRIAAYRGVADHLVFFPASFDVPGQLHRLADLAQHLRADWPARECPGADPTGPALSSPTAAAYGDHA
jgi:alkanesulfonate monooxygenase SsuD/methylene tetrahydromethanopterin reductase-like flavin-dependent oxidoreductase (luciferase family)